MKSMSVVGSCAPIVTHFWYVSAPVPWPFLDMPWWVTFALGIRLVDVVAGVTAAIITTLYVMADVVVIQGANVVVHIAIGVLDELYRVTINVSVMSHNNIYQTFAFLAGAAESKFKKIIDQKAWWKLMVDLDSLPNSQWRYKCSWSGRLYDCLSDGGCFQRFFPRFQQYHELMLHKMRLLDVSENMIIRIYGHKHTL